MSNIAVVLMNLGGPSHEKAIRPFLFNFFMDKNIIRLPYPLRWIVAKTISKRRSKKEALAAYSQLGGKSPLLENTRRQALALEEMLDRKYPDVRTDIRVFTAMRYWHPLSKEAVSEVKAFHADAVILLALYPQYSTTTTFSSFQNWKREAKRQKLHAHTKEICCYPLNDGFITASADRIRQEYAKAPKGTRLLFSAHGLPESIIKGGDPYQQQCEASASAIVEALAIPGLDWEICYQSRVGPLKWIGPSTSAALQKAAAEGKGVVIYPHAFVSEHVETLVEIDIEYRHMAKEWGIPYFARVETVGTHPDFIRGLADIVTDTIEGKPFQKTCPAGFSRCGCRA